MKNHDPKQPWGLNVHLTGFGFWFSFPKMEGKKWLWGRDAKIWNFEFLVFCGLPVKALDSWSLCGLKDNSCLLLVVMLILCNLRSCNLFLRLSNNYLTATYSVHFYKTHDCPEFTYIWPSKHKMTIGDFKNQPEKSPQLIFTDVLLQLRLYQLKVQSVFHSKPTFPRGPLPSILVKSPTEK